MIIPVTFPSAALFWLNYNPAVNLNRYALGSRELISLPKLYDCRIDMETAKQLASVLGLPCPVSVMSPVDSIKYRNRCVHTIQRPNALPADCFIELKDGAVTSLAKNMKIYMASPELCFLQAAQVMDFHQLVIFGTDLCGIYIRDPLSPYQQRSRNPVVSINNIREFLETAYGSYGRRNALRAGTYILDRSNSGMETMLSVLAMLTASLGGYALLPPRLNSLLDLSAEGRRIMQGKSCYGDMVWDPQRVDLEYDSEISHLTSRQHRIDKQRASAMAVSGYTTISITRSDVSTLSKLDETFTGIRRILGMSPIDAKLRQYLPERKKLLYIFKTFRIESPETYRCR